MANEKQNDSEQGKQTKPEYPGGRTGGQTDSATGEKPGGGRPLDRQKGDQQKQK